MRAGILDFRARRNDCRMLSFLGKCILKTGKRQLLCIGLCRPVTESGVRQTKSKWKLGRIWYVEVARKVFGFALLNGVIWIGRRSSGIQRVVV